MCVWLWYGYGFDKLTKLKIETVSVLPFPSSVLDVFFNRSNQIQYSQSPNDYVFFRLTIMNRDQEIKLKTKFSFLFYHTLIKFTSIDKLYCELYALRTQTECVYSAEKANNRAFFRNESWICAKQSAWEVYCWLRTLKLKTPYMCVVHA